MAAAPYRPHIVLILTDQQRYDTIAALGFDHMETPNLDRLVREGVSFDRCYITAPSCCPSRASLFQGCYPHSTGVYKNGDTWTQTWVSDLAAAGYRCVNVGKMHTVPFTTPAGFHERYVVENKDRYLEGRFFFDEWDKALRARGVVKQQREFYRRRSDYRERMGAFTWDLAPDLQSDNFVGALADWWLTTYPLEQPLLMEIGFPGPHPPYDPTPDALGRYLHKALPIRDWAPEEVEAQPAPLRRLRRHMMEVDHDSVVHLERPTAEQRRYQRASYLANVSMIDEQVGRVMDTMRRRGLLDDAVIIFTSDHGDSLGDHGHSQKWTMYEEVVRVPAVVWMGDRARRELGAREPGSRVDGLVSLFDFGPTILELAGLGPDPAMEAVSLVPLLRSAGAGQRDGTVGRTTGNADHAPAGGAVALSDSTWEVTTGRPPFVNADNTRQYVFAEHGRDNILEGTAVMTMVRDERWKLVTYSGGDGQLFDLATDPDERQDLWDDPSHAAERRRLGDVLHDWYRESLYQTRARRRR